MDIKHWIISLTGFAIGLFFWCVTYILAPLESKKKGKYVSGCPGIPFVCFFLAGLISPCKWLALLCFADLSVTILPFFLLNKYVIKRDRNNQNDKKQEEYHE